MLLKNYTRISLLSQVYEHSQRSSYVSNEMDKQSVEQACFIRGFYHNFEKVITPIEKSKKKTQKKLSTSAKISFSIT